jgi:hypothetical protein
VNINQRTHMDSVCRIDISTLKSASIRQPGWGRHMDEKRLTLASALR